LVRNLPVRYPPAAEATHWVTISQIAAATVNVVGETPLSDHGETDAMPTPDPSARSIRDVAAATAAPQKIAGHETAECEDSTAVSCGCTPRALRSTCRTSMILILGELVPEQRKQDDDRNRHTQQPQQNSPTHDLLLLINQLASP
jgi:hypothetical protein